MINWEARIMALSFALESKPLCDALRDYSREVMENCRAKYLRIWMPSPDPEFAKEVAHLSPIQPFSVIRDFVELFAVWINSGPVQVLGLDGFHPTLGTGAQSFLAEFIQRHRSRVFRLFPGEYHYFAYVLEQGGYSWRYVTTEDPLQAGDALVVSHPFFGTGNLTPDFDEVLGVCDGLDVPVAVDCCFVPTLGEGTIDLRHDCIDSVYFTLSKVHPVSGVKVAVRYSRHNTDGSSYLNDCAYLPTIGSAVGLQVMKRYQPNDYATKHAHKQATLCREIPGMSASHSVFSALCSPRFHWINERIWEFNPQPHADLIRKAIDPVIQRMPNKITLDTIYYHWDLIDQPSDASDDMTDLAIHYMKQLRLRSIQ